MIEYSYSECTCSQRRPTAILPTVSPSPAAGFICLPSRARLTCLSFIWETDRKKQQNKTKQFLFVPDSLEGIIYGLHGTAPLLSPHTEPGPHASRIIIIYFFPHTAAPSVTPSDPIEIDFVVELPASAN